MSRYSYFKTVGVGKTSHLKFCNDTAKKLITVLHKKVGKENLNWKVIASKIFSLKKSHGTKQHIDVIKFFWKKHNALASAKNIYPTTPNIWQRRFNQRPPTNRTENTNK